MGPEGEGDIMKIYKFLCFYVIFLPDFKVKMYEVRIYHYLLYLLHTVCE
jgi:hypothetical protein